MENERYYFIMIRLYSKAAKAMSFSPRYAKNHKSQISNSPFEI